MALINPHINFNGNAEEAFTFYKSVFGGEFAKVIRFKDLASSEFPVEKKEENKIKGCQSTVWLNSCEKDGRIFFEADSDSTFVKGEIALLIRALSGQKPEDIVNAELKFIDRIGLKEHLSPTRANGLVSMIKQMKLDALALSKTTN